LPSCSEPAQVSGGAHNEELDMSVEPAVVQTLYSDASTETERVKMLDVSFQTSVYSDMSEDVAVQTEYKREEPFR
jgi:hypothetical protein